MSDITREQLETLIKCSESIEYFAENFVKIIHPINGLIDVSLKEEQSKIIKTFEEKNMFSKCMDRQSGKTTVASIILLHQAIFGNYKTIAIFAPKQEISNHILYTIMSMYEHLPAYFKPSIKTANKSKMVFENGSILISLGSSFMSSKGMTLNVVYIDESEWIKRLEDFRDFLLPVISSMNTKSFALYSTLSSEIFRER